MTHLSVAQVIARANASLVGADLDVAGIIASLLAGAAEALPADAAAVLVRSDGSLDLLAATSHRVADLEVHQAQVDEGPCVDTIELGSDVDVVGREAIEERWPSSGPVISSSGYASVHATPMTWHGVTFGGLNLFRVEPTSFLPLQMECQALADAVTLAIVNRYLDVDHVTNGLRAALEERALVEQAKGALAYARSLDMPTAYDALLAMAQSEGRTLGVMARRVMDQARGGTLGHPPRPGTEGTTPSHPDPSASG
jgi:hypothetical protein